MAISSGSASPAYRFQNKEMGKKISNTTVSDFTPITNFDFVNILNDYTAHNASFSNKEQQMYLMIIK
jgi:hypothetical protein